MASISRLCSRRISMRLGGGGGLIWIPPPSPPPCHLHEASRVLTQLAFGFSPLQVAPAGWRQLWIRSALVALLEMAKGCQGCNGFKSCTNLSILRQPCYLRRDWQERAELNEGIGAVFESSEGGSHTMASHRRVSSCSGKCRFKSRCGLSLRRLRSGVCPTMGKEKQHDGQFCACVPLQLPHVSLGNPRCSHLCMLLARY